MKTIALFFFLIVLPLRAQDNISNPAQKLAGYFQNASENSQNGDHKSAMIYMDSALAITPNYAPVQYEKARMLVRAGENEQALEILNLLLDQKQRIVERVSQDTIFNRQAYFEEFLKKSQQQEVINNSTEYVTLEEHDLVPEGVAYDEKDEVLYISSIYKRKIVMIDQNREVSDFVTSGQDGLMSVIGMEADPVRRHLWVCSSYDPSNEIVGGEALAHQAAIFKYDLDTRELIRKYTVNDTLKHFYNDITILPNGNAYFTDSGVGDAYVITTEDDEISPLFEEPFLLGANGITKDEAGENLFISSWLRGIIKYNVASGEWKWLESGDPAANTTGMDGMAYYRGSLIVNSPFNVKGILQFELNATGDQIEKMKVLEYGNPLFGSPTTGEIGGDTFYYIADAGLEAYDRSTGKLEKGKLAKPVILKIDLNE